METLKFSVKLKSVPVIIEDNADVEHKFTMKELTGKERAVYLGEMGSKMTFDDAGKPTGLSSFEGLQSGLLALCLFDENEKPVEKDVLESYPAGVLSSLFAAAQELSGLTAAAQEQAKND